MSRKYHSYHIQILNEPYVAHNVTYSHTVFIEFLNRNHKVLDAERYGLADTDSLYRQLSETGILNLNNLYVKNFSLSEFRSKYGFGKNDVVKLEQFSAINTFFDAADGTDFSHTVFSGMSADFLNSHFGGGSVSFYKSSFLDLDVDFSNVNFGNETVNFQFADFGNGGVSFENAVFGDGDILFVNTNFGDGKAIFRNTDFGIGDVDFHFSKFGKGDVSFDKAVFGGQRVDFRRVEFGDGKLEFTRTDFGHGEVSFEEAEGGVGRKSFKRAKFGHAKVSFELCVFYEELNFEGCEFEGGKISFFKGIFKGLSFKGCQLNLYLDLRVEKCGRVDLSNTIIKDIVDLKPGFSKVEIDGLFLHGARNLGKIFLDWRENNVYRLIAGQQETSNREKAEQFRMLKEDFNTSGQYEDEDHAYVEFKRFELRHIRENAIRKHPNKKWLYILSTNIQRFLFDHMGLYATSPIRVLRSMLIVYFFFTLLYLFFPLLGWGEIQTGLSNPEPLSSLAISMYYSAVTFFTIGYGDYFPYGLLRWVACVEGFAGVFMMSYFVVAFVRKMLR